jgi:hypothetical protein
MSSTITECEIFTYTVEEMERMLMSYIDHLKDTAIKTVISRELSNTSEKNRKNVYKRILKFKNGLDWWDCISREMLATELTLIWRLGVKSMKGYYSTKEGGLEGHAFRELEDLEKEMEEGKINEHEYIQRCNIIRDIKVENEKIMNACICSILGKVDDAEIVEDDGSIIDTKVFRVMCLPCGWGGASQI